MQAKILILREHGALHVPIGMSRRLHGELCLRHEPMPGEERTIPVLRVIVRHGPSPVLYDPKIVSIGCGTMKIAGLERVDRAWFAQEWSCEVGAE